MTPRSIVDPKESSKFDDLLRRLDHHAYIVRAATTDFFKTMFLVQGGGLVTLCITIISHFASASDLKQVSQADLPEEVKQKVIGILQPHFPDYLIIPTKVIAANLVAGMAFSFCGYMMPCYKAHSKTGEYRGLINEYLFSKAATIKLVKSNTRTELESLYAFYAVLTLLFLSVSVDTGTMIYIIWTIIRP